MNGRRREQITGVYPGQYAVGERKKADIPVTAEGPEGPVVVGRFPISKAVDADSQAKAYAALPHMIDFLRNVARHSDTYGGQALSILATAGVDA
jgi:hypothetical protein